MSYGAGSTGAGSTGTGARLARGNPQAQLRAAAADREHVIDVLRTAFADSRIGQDEYESRVERALSAVTYADLNALLTDLPGTRPVMAPAPPSTNTLAVTALVCGVAQFFTFGLATIPAVVLGHMARHQIRRTGEEGRGLATAGLILGWIGVGIMALVILGSVILVSVLAHTSTAG